MRGRSRAAALIVIGTLIAGVSSAAPATAAVPAFTHTETISRAYLNADGSSSVVDTRTVTLTVSATHQLRGRQQIAVSWSGAHPTGGIVTDPNSEAASREEYPMVLMECRGVDSAAAPPGQRLTPNTCWTQTPDERYQEVFTPDGTPGFPEWRLDRYETAADRAAVVNPPPASANCDDGANASRYTPFDAVDGTVFYGGANGLCGLPPESANVEDPSAPPANTTYGVTLNNAKHTGSASFVVWSEAENASLGCSNTVPCALVAIPIMGISCDPTALGLPDADRPPADEIQADTDECEKTGRYAPGEPSSTDVNLGPGDTAVVGALWWSASNWRNRITVPLTFAPPANVCDVLDTRTPVDIYGSELMDQAAGLWQQKFCTDSSLFKFQHVSTGEPEAESALATGSISAALISRPPPGGYTVPTVNAPIAVTGFGISYVIDRADGTPETTLRLNARLLAKLLTESYWARADLGTVFKNLPASNPYAKMAHNPEDISTDPEFIKLNPGIGPTNATQPAAALLALSGNSDVMYALTSYINADPDARAFLNGKPDPWGMTVNPRYKGIKLPLNAWPLLDTFLAPTLSLDGCLLNDQQKIVPVPILPLVAAPMATLEGIAQAMEFAIANSDTNCAQIQNIGGVVLGGSLKPIGREPPGHRFMIGITSLGDAGLFGLRNAALQSSPSHYAEPTDASLRAAIATSSENTTSHTWSLSAAKLRATSSAYPGTMVVYAAIPTQGLDATTAGHLAQFLLYAASDGQKPGLDIGLLPPGYLPMTSANGLGAMVTYTKAAAAYVAAQTGQVTGTPPVTTGDSGGGGGSGSGGTTPSTPGKPSPTASTSASPPYIPPIDKVNYTASVGSNSASWALPITVLVSIVAMVIAIVFRTAASMRSAANLDNRLRRLADNESGDRR